MRRTQSMAATLLAIALLLMGAMPALAHEQRPVGGKYKLVVGFLHEPAIVGELNGAYLRVTLPAENDRPVQGLEKTLQAEVVVGGNARSMPLELQPLWGQPGTYVGYFVPTREGSYQFHFSGTIEGLPVDERFESGPGRFDDVRGTEAIQFPDKIPSGAATLAEVQAARAEAESARLLAVAGLAIGALGALLAVVSLFRRRSSANSGRLV